MRKVSITDSEINFKFCFQEETYTSAYKGKGVHESGLNRYQDIVKTITLMVHPSGNYLPFLSNLINL